MKLSVLFFSLVLGVFSAEAATKSFDELYCTNIEKTFRALVNFGVKDNFISFSSPSIGTIKLQINSSSKSPEYRGFYTSQGDVLIVQLANNDIFYAEPGKKYIIYVSMQPQPDRRIRSTPITMYCVTP